MFALILSSWHDGDSGSAGWYLYTLSYSSFVIYTCHAWASSSKFNAKNGSIDSLNSVMPFFLSSKGNPVRAKNFFISQSLDLGMPSIASAYPKYCHLVPPCQYYIFTYKINCE